MTFRASKTTVTLRSGKVVPLDHALVIGMRRPTGGWVATFRINGIDKTFTGRSPQELGNTVLREHQKNNVSLSVADLWLNLNLQWMERLDQKYFLVDRSELTKLILQEGQTAEVTQRQVITPEKWGSIAWKWLGLLLAQDGYTPEVFVLHCEQVLTLLNPSLNPGIGCIRCFADFAAEMSRIRMNPPKGLDEARRWLWEFHNSVNVKTVPPKPQISFERAAALNFWR